jgi:hypothetical protein
MTNYGVIFEIHMRALCEFLSRHRSPAKSFQSVLDRIKLNFDRKVFRREINNDS